MRSKLLRRTAIAVSLSAFALSGVASADQNYSSPSRWNNFRPALDEALAAEDAADDLLGGAADDLLGGAADELPAPRLAAPARQSIQQGTINRESVQNQFQGGSYQPAQAAQPTPASGHNAGHHNQPMGNVVTGQPHYSGGYPPASYSDQPQYSPAPQQHYQSAPQQMGSYSTMPTSAAPVVGSGSSCQSCQGGPGHSHSYSSPSPYSEAMSSPWDGGSSFADGSCGGSYASAGAAYGAGRPELYPWFGGGNVLLFNLQEGKGRRIATGLNQNFFTSDLDPDMSVGYDVSLGRYLSCGKYGLGMRFFQWNPGKTSITRFATAEGDGTTPSTMRAAQPQYRDAFLDHGAGPVNVYDTIDNSNGSNFGAYQVRMTRDLNFYGLELNLFQFGLMGAQRAAYSGCAPGPHELGAGMGLGHGRGFGGAAGPLVRANSGRLRVANSHGIRYMRITDETNIAYGVDLDATTRVTIFDDLDTENEMLGYQFGSTLTYCLGSRFELNLGGKFGIYGNRATMKHRLGTDTQVAYLTAGGTDDIDTESSDTVLSTLGELDLGLGCRVSRGWTVRGGYRLMGVTGVANAVDSRGFAYTNIAEISQVHADDSYLLHGAYIGGEFNW